MVRRWATALTPKSIAETYRWAWQPLESHGIDSYLFGAWIGVIRFAPFFVTANVILIVYAVAHS